MRKIKILFLFIALFYSCKSTKTAVVEQELTQSELEKKRFTGMYLRATNMAMIENTDKAILYYENCKEINPKIASTYYELSRLYALKKDAQKSYNNALLAYKINPKNKWYLLQKASIQRATGQYDKAIESYEELVRMDKKNLLVLYDLIDLYKYKGKYKKAVNTITKIEAISGVNPQITYQKYLFLKDAGEEKEAQKVIEKLLKQDPESGIANLAMAQKYQIAGKEDQAYQSLIYVFEDAQIKTDTKLSILTSYISKSIDNEKKSAQTLNLISIIQRVHPKNVKSYVVAGDYYSTLNQPKKANENYEKALMFTEKPFPIYMQLLENEMSLKNYKKMISYSESAMELYPTQPVFYLYNGIGYSNLKEYDKAISAYNSGMNLLIDNEKLEFQFYSQLGETYNQKKEYVNSDKFYEKAMSINGLDPFMLNNYSYYLSLRKEKLDKAAELSRKANNVYPNNSSFNDTYGWILFQLGEYVEAEKWVKKSLENGGDASGTVLEHYGDIMIQQNNPEKAVEYWKKAQKKGDFSDKLIDKIKDKKYYE